MASLQKLLSEEGFERRKFNKTQRQVRFRERNNSRGNEYDHSIALPIYICHDRKSFDKGCSNYKPKPPKTVSSKRESLDYSKRSNSISSSVVRSEPAAAAMDEVAIRAVISILTGYVGRFLKDESFRVSIRKKCYSCFPTTLTSRRRRKSKDSDDNRILSNLELGIESIERLVVAAAEEEEDNNPGEEKKIKLLRHESIRLLSTVVSCVRATNLCACAQLYMSILYKLEKNDRISALHLLQVFSDSPFIARTHLLPDLWDHFFLPHLLHLKIWHTNEIEFLSNLESIHKENKMKTLDKVYNDQMDMGTAKFALYYKEWLTLGSHSPSLPSVPLPNSTLTHKSSRRLSSDSLALRTSIDKSLYGIVFGPKRLERTSMDLEDQNRALINTWNLEEEQKEHIHENNLKQNDYAEHRIRAHRRSSSQIYRSPKAELWPERQKSDIFWLSSCQSEPTQSLADRSHVGRPHGSMRRTEKTKVLSNDFTKAITTICTSDSLRDCEVAIRVIVKTWLDLNGDLTIEKSLSKAPVIEGMLEVLFSSNDNEILELAISILAEIVTRNEANGHIIINSDPELEIFVRLLRSSSLFLKAAILLYLVKPKAKQMISIEWIPLVLRVLEFGDQLQTLLAVQCSPQVAAYYFLDQLLTGFDEDKNLENARQVVYTGGLSLLVKRIEKGDPSEKGRASSIIFCCIQADGGCRHYLATNFNKGSIIELVVTGQQKTFQCHGLQLLTELLCLNRRTDALILLNELVSGWGSLNTMHILFVHLQRVKLEERSIVAAILLQLDLLGDPVKCSVYREEAIDAIIGGLDCEMCNEEVQEQSTRALSLLGGRFSYKGKATAEKWILKKAGFSENFGDSFQGKDIVLADLMHLNVEEDDAMENWQRNTAIALVTSGKKRLLGALCDSIANGIPCLARASIVTVAWISCYLHMIPDENLQSVAFSVLFPHLVQSLDQDRAIEERVLASFTLLNLSKCTDFLSKISPVDERLMSHLGNISQVTWTADELISIFTNKSRPSAT